MSYINTIYIHVEVIDCMSAYIYIIIIINLSSILIYMWLIDLDLELNFNQTPLIWHAFINILSNKIKYSAVKEIEKNIPTGMYWIHHGYGIFANKSCTNLSLWGQSEYTWNMPKSHLWDRHNCFIFNISMLRSFWLAECLGIFTEDGRHDDKPNVT